MKKIFFIIILVQSFFVFNSCTKDALNPTLADQVDTTIRSVDDMTQLLDGSYNYMSDYRYWGRNVIIAGEVRADNVFANGNSGRFVTMGQMNLLPNTGDVADIMNYIYGSVANANLIINADGEITGDADEINHAKGQAYAIRALAHFDLLRLFGQQHVSGQGGLNSLGISYVTEFKGENVARGTVAENKQMIYDDLDQALSLMSETLNDDSKVHFTTYAVYALKARVATYFKDYSVVRSSCEAILGDFSVVEYDDYVASWASPSAPYNSIFELAQSSTDNNGNLSIANIYRGTSYGDIQVLDGFVADAGFEEGDIRASESMIAVQNGRLRNVGKYPDMLYTDNIKVLRYEEVILNYAEALLETNTTLALTYLNMIPSKRGATPYTEANLQNIIKERRKEFAFEGFRFDDLARNGMAIPVIDPVNQTHGGPSYGSYNYAMPIPRREVDNNPLSSQNYGYGE